MDAPYFTFDVMEGPSSTDPTQFLTSPWQISVLATGGPAGSPDLIIQVPGYQANGHRDPVTDAVSYTYTDGNGQPLTGPDAMQIAERQLMLVGQLDAIGAQNGQVILSITRNQYVSIADNLDTFPAAFTYETPQVTFKGPVYPLLTLTDALDLSSLAAGPVSLATYLQAFLVALLATDFPQPAGQQVNVQALLGLAVPLQPGNGTFNLPPVTYPIALQLAQPLDVKATVDEVVDYANGIAPTVNDWLTSNGFTPTSPAWDTAQLTLDVTVFPPQGGTGAPILALNGLYLPLSSLAVSTTDR
jgi:hypothetical protein